MTGLTDIGQHLPRHATGRLDRLRRHLVLAGDSDHRARRLADTMASAVLVCVVLVQYLNVDSDPSQHGRHGYAMADALVILLFSGFHVFVARQPAGPQRYRRALWITVPLEAIATYVPLIWFGLDWTSMPAILAAAVLLLLPRTFGVALAVLAIGSVTIGSALDGQSATTVAYTLVGDMLFCFTIFAVTRLAGFVSQLHAARVELAGSAVERERLRFARDLHDLLGYSLTAITLKGEHAARVLPADQCAAGEDLDTLLKVSRQALTDVRAVARSYRDMSLTNEATTAQSMLESAGITTQLTLDLTDPLPTRIDTTLATVLRECVTNLIRHSNATTCHIEATQHDHHVRLRIANNGVTNPDTGDGRGGLTNLTDRITTLGGTLHAGPDTTGWYTVHAHLELPTRG